MDLSLRIAISIYIILIIIYIFVYWYHSKINPNYNLYIYYCNECKNKSVEEKAKKTCKTDECGVLVSENSNDLFWYVGASSVILAFLAVLTTILDNYLVETVTIIKDNKVIHRRKSLFGNYDPKISPDDIKLEVDKNNSK